LHCIDIVVVVVVVVDALIIIKKKNTSVIPIRTYNDIPKHKSIGSVSTVISIY
jgi:hypothetical protein